MYMIAEAFRRTGRDYISDHKTFMKMLSPDVRRLEVTQMAMSTRIKLVIPGRRYSDPSCDTEFINESPSSRWACNSNLMSKIEREFASLFNLVTYGQRSAGAHWMRVET